MIMAASETVVHAGEHHIRGFSGTVRSSSPSVRRHRKSAVHHIITPTKVNLEDGAPYLQVTLGGGWREGAPAQ